MRAKPLAAAVALVLVVALPAAVLAFPGGAGVLPSPLASRATGAGASDDSDGARGADDGHGGAHAKGGMHAHERARTEWPEAEGEIPASPDGLHEVWRLEIEGVPDLEALAEEGIEVPGSGTFDDPFVIEGLGVRDVLEIKDTDDYYVIRENFIAGELRLNWNADKVHVHHNYVNDLRVNENVERTGDATGGLVEKNKLGIVGQIRHFDGVFRDNVVGPAPRGPFRDVMDDTGALVPWFQDRRVVNIDGFDGAVFERNTIAGYVEMQLHGHHHASCFDCHSHNHGDLEKAAQHDHSVRYHEAVFRDNAITVKDGVAFRYTDEAHSGDDRTAASETDEDLEKPHVHYTRILVENNRLTGGALVVDVFNADDFNHENEETEEIEAVDAPALHGYRGDFVIRGNTVSYKLADQTLKVRWLDDTVRDGLLVRGAKEMTMLIEGNAIQVSNAKQGSALSALPLVGRAMGGDSPAGIHLEDLEAGQVDIRGNTITGTHFGVLASRMDEDLAWALATNAFRDVTEDVAYDESVENPPEDA